MQIFLSIYESLNNADTSHELHLKNYICFGMSFSFAVEMLSMAMMSRAKKK
ncbi:hypothetical protein [Ferruginibacter sp.]|nr:hypothetical protein [Ferruginibacter sp.]